MNPILRVHLIIIEFFPFIQDPFGALWGALDSFGNVFGRSFFALRRRAKFPDLLLGWLGSHGVPWGSSGSHRVLSRKLFICSNLDWLHYLCTFELY